MVLPMDQFSKAKEFLIEAQRMEARAMKEDEQTKRRMMMSVAEHYYLLHDALMDFGEAFPAEAMKISI